MATHTPGSSNLITDVSGISVEHVTDEQAQTGVTVLTFDKACTAAVDVRGGGPGTRETELLSSENLVGAVDAIVLTGGSVFGLGAADGVVSALSNAQIGLKFVDGPHAIPIVPCAVLHDLANTGDKQWGDTPPYRALGKQAAESALGNRSQSFALGAVGAGRGAQAGDFKGGIGSASIQLGDGLVVGALVAVNSMGTAVLPDGQSYYAWPYELDGEFGGLRPKSLPDMSDPFPVFSRLHDGKQGEAGSATTLAVIATNADLSNGECKRVAMMAQDGMARAIRPIHTPFDGDIVFAAATAEIKTARDDAMTRATLIAKIGSAAADCLARAIARGVFEARRSSAS